MPQRASAKTVHGAPTIRRLARLRRYDLIGAEEVTLSTPPWDFCPYSPGKAGRRFGPKGCH
jgi:hypothetical protein